MRKFNKGDLFGYEDLVYIDRETLKKKELIKIYELMLETLYSNPKTNLEKQRVKEINFIITYLQSDELADEFSKYNDYGGMGEQSAFRGP